MKKYILLMVILNMMFSCSKKEEIKHFTIIDESFYFLVVNSNGENLFDVTTENHWDANAIRLYYVKNDEPVLFYKDNLDAPNGCLLTQKYDYNNVLVVFMNYDPDSEKSVTYINWNETRIDTLEATYETGNGHRKKEVWFNGEKVWDYYEMGSEYYCQKIVVK